MLRFAREKRGIELAYRYSATDKLNVLRDSGQPVAGRRWLVASTMSKTNARAETDDPDP